MTAPKLNFDKLRQSLAGHPRPSESEGTKRPEYASSYKSPYSKRVDIQKRPSAPSVLVSPPASSQTKASVPSLYSQAEIKKSRRKEAKKDLRFTQDSSDHQIAPTQLPRKTSAISGFFTSANAGSSEEKPKYTGAYISPLMNAPSLLGEKQEGRARAWSLSASPAAVQPIPPLIPPKPANSDDLPQLVPVLSPIQLNTEDNDSSYKVYTRPRGSVAFKEPFNPTKNKRVSLMLDPARRHTIRDGSIDLDLDKIAFAQVSNDNNDEEDEVEAEVDNFFCPLLNKTDSLISIRSRLLVGEEEESFSVWSGHRSHFCCIFFIYMTLSVFATLLTHVFVFYYNYGFELPPESVPTNVTVELHIKQRYLLNLHMYLMIVPTIQVLQFSTLLFRMFPSVSRTAMKWSHGVLHLSAAGCRITGAYYAFAYHAISPSDELYSMHSYIAILSMFLHVVAVLIGIIFILPCCSWETRVTLIPLHRYAGNLIILTDTASILSGCLQITNKYFAFTTFPQWYSHPYHELSPKSIVINSLGIVTAFVGAIAMYLQAHYQFRRRKQPEGEMAKDLDLEAINRVTERRQHRALAKEAKEHGKNNVEEIQIGSRKSFNLAGRQKYWHLVTANQGKSIPALINKAEKQKSNFTDTDRNILVEALSPNINRIFSTTDKIKLHFLVNFICSFTSFGVKIRM